jgi:hypothetical protein
MAAAAVAAAVARRQVRVSLGAARGGRVGLSRVQTAWQAEPGPDSVSGCSRRQAQKRMWILGAAYNKHLHSVPPQPVPLQMQAWD